MASARAELKLRIAESQAQAQRILRYAIEDARKANRSAFNWACAGIGIGLTVGFGLGIVIALYR